MRSQHLKTGCVWVLSGGLSLAFAGFTTGAEPQTKAPKEVKEGKSAEDLPFTVSKETTRFTEPRKPDGTVDFAGALNARLSQGVTPENNAGVLLIEAIGANTVPEEHRKAFFRDLGIAEPAGEGSLKDFGQFVEGRLKADGNAGEIEKVRAAYNEQFSKALDGPWSRKELPVVADWLDTNTDALKLLLAASQRPRLFIPVIRGDKDPILNTNLEMIQRARVFYRLLTARAMLALEEGRIEDAERDLLAGHRLAALFSHQPMIINTLVAYAFDAVSYQGSLAVAQSGKASPEQLAGYHQKLAELPPLARLSDIVDQGERFVSLDAICHMAMHQDEATAQAFGIPKPLRRFLGLSIDWDLIMKRFNEEYDKIAAALKQPTHPERMAAIDTREEELKKLRGEANNPGQFALMFLGVDPPRAVVSRQMGNALMSLLMPAVRQAATAETRAQNRRDLTLIAFALAEYHRENGRYPEALTELAPQYLKTIPVDRFTDKPLKYQRRDNGYLLYSVGINGKDDQGERGSAQNPTADDWAIRVPKLPEL